MLCNSHYLLNKFGIIKFRMVMAMMMFIANTNNDIGYGFLIVTANTFMKLTWMLVLLQLLKVEHVEVQVNFLYVNVVVVVGFWL